MLKGRLRVLNNDVIPLLNTALFGADRQRSEPAIKELHKHVRQTLSNH
jgi:hypothetical protein